MKKRFIVPTLVMYSCFLLWGVVEVIYYIYFFPNYQARFISGNLLKMIPGIFICAYFIFTTEKIEKKYSSRRKYLLASSFINIILITLIDSLITLSIYTYIDKVPYSIRLGPFLTYIMRWILFYFGAGVLFYFLFYHKKSVEQEIQLNLSKALADEAHLIMLRYQINPHFLFNTLNTIQSVTQTNHIRAKEMITELSEFFKYTLSKNDRNFVLLKEELGAVKNYLSIQKERFGESLEITFDVSAQAADLEIPFFIIHPLVENAIKYGFQSGMGTLQLLIKVAKIENGIAVLVQNTGTLKSCKTSWLPEQKSTKTGIDNLKKRLALLYPGSHELLLYEKDGFVNAEITLKGKGVR